MCRFRASCASSIGFLALLTSASKVGVFGERRRKAIGSLTRLYSDFVMAQRLNKRAFSLHSGAADLELDIVGQNRGQANVGSPGSPIVKRTEDRFREGS